MNELDDQQLAFLTRFGFDAERQRRWQREIADGSLTKANNLVTEELLPPPVDAISALPDVASPAYRELDEIGRQAIADGHFGVAVLNGGMATRFGGVVKGVVEVRDQQSFLGFAVDDARRMAAATGGRIPVFLMNSFATDTATKEHFAANDNFGAEANDIEHYTQFIALRMTSDGELFRLDNGETSPYGPGHGDFAGAFRAAGCLQRFRDAGGRYLFVRNVDNLGARVNPTILGHHIASQREMTAELTAKWQGDVGGGPYLHQGRVQLVEQIRYPEGFDPDIIDVFNTNTITLNADALCLDHELGWYYVEKNVAGRPAVQIEHLIGEMTTHLSTNFLRVGREGPTSRFLPIKKPDDLITAQSHIAAIYTDGSPPN